MRLVFALAAALLASLVVAVPARAQTSDGCEGRIASWQEFAGKESQGGHMDDSVYNKIKTEIEQATEVCRSGQDARASKMIEASKRLHGY